MEALTNTGVYGVQLFFAASAFTLFLSYERATGDPHRNRSFYIRRFLRIAPMFYVGLVIYLIVDPMRGVATPGNLTGALTINLLLLHGLLPATLFSLVPGGWSIGVEFLFYMKLPTLFKIAADWRSLLITYAGSLVLAGAWHMTLEFWIRYFDSTSLGRSFLMAWIPNQLPVFLAGIGAFFIVRDQHPIIQWIKLHYWTAWAIELVLIACGKIMGTISYFWSPATFGLAFGFLIIVLSVKTPSWMTKIFARLGVLSFSVYILHFLFNRSLTPLISGAILKHLGQTFEASFLGFIISLIVVLGLSMVAATFSWHYIEQPFIKLSRSWAPSRASSQANAHA
jgi:peptidoglycan/LPS O-acetylase OafA/YrhL